MHEQGKPTFEAAGELHHLIHGLRYYADLSTKLRGSYQPLPSALGESYGLVIRRPVGVVAAIVPFNYPLTLMGTKIGPALVAGNTVVVKPAKTTPLSALIVAELMHEAGLPAGVLNVVTGTRRQHRRRARPAIRTSGASPSPARPRPGGASWGSRGRSSSG